MNKNRNLESILILVLFVFISSNMIFAQKIKKRLIYNNDGTCTLSNEIHNYRPISIQDVNDVVDIIANSQVTTYMICNGSSPVYYSSKFEKALGTPNKDQKCDCEEPVFLKAMKMYESNIKILEDQGTDVVKIILKRAKEKGMEAFITMRMNDLHFTDTALHCSRAESDFWRQHPEYWVGDYPGWHAYGALNFAHKEVRDYKLNLIREMCERYDFDGLDLDFHRFIIYFPFEQGQNHLKEMNDFVKRVKLLIDSTAKKKGKPILLSVRVPSTLKCCTEKGLDVKNWISNKLIDFITIGAHWTCDPDLPIREFKKDLGKINIPVYVSMDDGQYYLRESRSDGLYRGIASNYYSQGADGLYLFNYFFTEYLTKLNRNPKPKEGQVVRAVWNPEFLNEIGDAKTLKGRNKIYTLSDGITEYGFRPNTPLPKLISPWDQEKIFLNIPEDVKTTTPKEALLFFRVSKGANFKVYMNKKQLIKADTSNIFKYGRGANLVNEEEVQVYSVPVDLIENGYNRFDFRSEEPRPRLLRRLEVVVGFGDVEKFGYF